MIPSVTAVSNQEVAYDGERGELYVCRLSTDESSHCGVEPLTMCALTAELDQCRHQYRSSHT